MAAMTLSPIQQRRLQSFRGNRRGYWSMWIFLVLFTMLGLAAGIKVMLRSARELGDGSDGKAGDTSDAPDSGKRD